MLQELKNLLKDQWGLSPDLVLMLSGCLVYFAFNALLRKPALAPWGLVAPLVLALGLEACEIWDQYQHVGLFAPGNDPLLGIVVRHGLDVLKVMALPLVLVFLGIRHFNDGS